MQIEWSSLSVFFYLGNAFSSQLSLSVFATIKSTVAVNPLLYYYQMGTCVTQKESTFQRPTSPQTNPRSSYGSGAQGNQNPERAYPRNLLHKDDMLRLKKKGQFSGSPFYRDQRDLQGDSKDQRQKTRESLNLEDGLPDQASSAISRLVEVPSGILSEKRKRRNSQNMDVAREYSLCGSELKKWLKTKRSTNA